MNERQFYFANGNYNLYGMLHEAERHPNGRGFVLCHAFAEEKLWAHRVFVNFARLLAFRGYTVLRFDVMGHGDSEGDFEDSSIESRQADIRCAINFLKSKIRKVKKTGLVGLRLGATLAAQVAEKQIDLEPLVLWAPIVNGSQYVRELLRINIASQMAVYKRIRYSSELLIGKMKNGEKISIDGYNITWKLFDQIKSIDLLNKKSAYNGKALIVQMKKNGDQVDKKIAQLKSLYANCDLQIAKEDAFWKEIKPYYSTAENLFQTTLSWLRSYENES